jgi:predicted peptidase
VSVPARVVTVALALAALAVTAPGARGAEPAAPDTFAARFVERAVTTQGVRHRFLVWLPEGWTAAHAWPGIVVMHGSGECGDDPQKPVSIGLGVQLVAHPERWPAVVVFPQKAREDQEWWEIEDLVLAAADLALHEFAIDPDRLALTGMSQGGHGTWMIGARHPERWSCLAPVCGYGRATTIAPRVARMPVWAFHGLKDDIVDPGETKAIVSAIREERVRLGLSPDADDAPRMTLYPEANHDAWDPAYADAGLAAWLTSHRRTRP